MGFMEELKRLTRPYPDDDEAVDFTETEEPAARPAARRTYTETEAPAPAAQERHRTAGSKVVNISATTELQVVLAQPDRFDAVSEIASQLREKHAVVLNLEATNKDISRRLVDFLSGCAYALDGKIKKIAVSTYLITPYNVNIVGDVIDELENNGLYL